MTQPAEADAWFTPLPARRDELHDPNAAPTPETPTAGGSFIRSTTKGAAPSLGGLAGAGAGAEAGMALGAAGGPIGVAAGGIVGGLVGGFGGGYLVERAQDALLPESVKRALGLDAETQAADEAAQPWATFGGRMLPQVMTMGVSKSAMQFGLGAVIGGGTEAGTEYASTGTIDAGKVAASSAAGAVFGGDPNRMGRPFFGGGQRAVQAVRDIPYGSGATAAVTGARQIVAAGIDRAAAAQERSFAALFPHLPASVQRRWAAAGTLDDHMATEAARRAVGEQATPEERAAFAVLDANSFVRDSRPPGFEATPAADSVHGERLGVMTAALHAGTALPNFGARLVPGQGYSGDAAVAARLIHLESGGDASARNPIPGQTASGLGGITDATWRGLRAKYFAETAEQAMAARGNPDAQRATLAMAVRDERDLLQRAGVPVNDANVRTLHRFGPKGLDVIRADPETPLGAVIPAKWIAVNPELKGMTAGDAIALASREMGGRGDVPRVRAAVAGAAEPDEGDAWTTIVERLAREEGGEAPGALFHPDVGPIDVMWGNEEGGLRHILDKHPEVVDRLPDHLAAMEVVRQSDNRIRLESADHGAGVRLDYDGQAKRWLVTAYEKDASAPTDVTRAGAEGQDGSPAREAGRDIGGRRAGGKATDALTFLTRAGGIRDDEGHALGSQRNLQTSVVGAGKLIRDGGMSIDAAGERLWEAGYFGPPEVTERPSEADVLDLIERSTRERVIAPEHVADEYEARARVEDARARERADDDLDAALEMWRSSGLAVDFSKAERRYALQQMAAGLDAERAVDLTMNTPAEEIAEVIGVPASKVRKPASDEAYAFFEALARETPARDALSSYDDPAGDGAAMQSDGARHDIEAMAAQGDETVYDLGDGRSGTIEQLLADLDEEADAIAAARACMAPGNGGEA